MHAPGLKTIDDALEVRGRIFGALELAKLERDERQRDAWLTIAVKLRLSARRESSAI